MRDSVRRGVQEGSVPRVQDCPGEQCDDQDHSDDDDDNYDDDVNYDDNDNYDDADNCDGKPVFIPSHERLSTPVDD